MLSVTGKFLFRPVKISSVEKVLFVFRFVRTNNPTISGLRPTITYEVLFRNNTRQAIESVINASRLCQ